MNGDQPLELALWMQQVWTLLTASWAFLSSIPLIGNVASAGVVTLGFSMLFNIPRYALPWCVLIGMLGYATRFGLISVGVGIVLATLYAALLIGALATVCARRFKVSEALFAVSPAIVMVPGSYIYKAVLHLVMVANAPHLDHENEELLLAAFNESAKATLILLLLSFGIALPGLVWSAIQRMKSSDA